MKKAYTFPRGGISYEDPSAPSRNPAVTAFLPSLSIIPLVQHSWGRVFSVVSPGDTVTEGMLIGRGQGPGSSNVHATVPGKVIKTASWKMTGGQINDALVIKMEGSFEKLGKQEEPLSWEGMLPYDLQRVISDYGIVEMEGGGRPVSDIITSLKNIPKPITLVVRCVFDDPWLAADYVLCKERYKAVVEGSRIISRIIRANNIVYAVSSGEKDLGDLFIAEAGKWDPQSMLVLTGSRYPQRNRRELELVLRDYQKKEGCDLGSLVILGPATLAAIHDAVRYRKPILERYVAVGGTAVKKPQVLRVRIGTRIGDVISECGGFTGHAKRIATGSPFLGRAVADLDEPILKTSYAVFAFLEGRKAGTGSGICINCGECRNVCPCGLDPEELYKSTQVSNKQEDAVIREDVMQCHGCGCCDVVCPSRLPLSSAIITSAIRGSNG